MTSGQGHPAKVPVRGAQAYREDAGDGEQDGTADLGSAQPGAGQTAVAR